MILHCFLPSLAPACHCSLGGKMLMNASISMHVQIFSVSLSTCHSSLSPNVHVHAYNLMAFVFNNLRM